MALVGCGAADTVKIPDNTEVSRTSVEVPAWTQGEFPVEEAFFGHGEAPIVNGDVAAATEAARAKALENLRMEMQILSGTINRDHEEQVAEVISKYSIDDMAKNIKIAEDRGVDGAELVATFTDDGKTPPRQHMLVKLPIEAYFAAVASLPELPDEQKKRVRDFRSTFVDNVLTNLARQR
jgi:hypothetical protein